MPKKSPIPPTDERGVRDTISFLTITIGDAPMESLRLATAGNVTSRLECSRCGDDTRDWDRIAGRSCCPHCLERLASGETEPIIERVDGSRCAVCYHLGSIRYVTYPLHSNRPIEIDLCGEHLRALIARRLGPHAFEQLRRQLSTLELRASDVFLLHEAFYDAQGRALQPVCEGFF